MGKPPIFESLIASGFSILQITTIFPTAGHWGFFPKRLESNSGIRTMAAC